MDTLFSLLRRSIVGGLLIAFAFVFVYVPQPLHTVKKAEAQLTVFDPAAVAWLGSIGALNTSQVALLSTMTVTQLTLLTKDTILDGIAWILAKTIISQLIGSIINWVNSGFKGKPAFVSDLKRFLLDAADKAAGEYIKALGGVGSFICSPFRLDIQIAIALEYQGARDDQPEEECRLSDIVDNIEEFYNGTFADSSLEDFITISSNPEKYTPYGQLLQAKSSLRMRLANAERQNLKEVDWAGGFLSGKICKAVNGSASGSTEKCVISKPGQVIASSLNKALGAGQDGLIQADEINELIAALIGQLANKALSGAAGLLGLSAGTGYTEGGFNGGSYISAAINQSGNLTVGSSTQTTATQSSGRPDPDTLKNIIAVQDRVVPAANAVTGKLLDYANNTSNTTVNREEARKLYNSAIFSREKALTDRAVLSSILAEVEDLNAEYANTATTPERKEAIVSRKNTLQGQINSINPITQAQLDELIRNWQSYTQ
jgi:hypothetical protein